MTKYMILLIFMGLGSFLFTGTRRAAWPALHLESLKTPVQGPVLHPLRPKPYQKRLVLNT